MCLLSNISKTIAIPISISISREIERERERERERKRERERERDTHIRIDVYTIYKYIFSSVNVTCRVVSRRRIAGYIVCTSTIYLASA